MVRGPGNSSPGGTRYHHPRGALPGPERNGTPPAHQEPAMDRRSDQPQSPSALAAALLASLRDGSAGFVSRLGLSLASAAAGIAALMVTLGLAEASSHRIRDEHVALGAMLVLLVWVGALYGLWATYSRKRHVVKTVFACVGIAVLTAGISGLLGAF